MANIKNILTFGDGFNITAQAPIDSRVRVNSLSDLIASDSWNLSEFPPYDGLIVSVIDTGNVYVLTDATNPYSMDNWKLQTDLNWIEL